MTQEKLQGAIDLINEITGSTFELERDSRSYRLIDDGQVIADGNLEHLYNVLVSEARDLIRD